MVGATRAVHSVIQPDFHSLDSYQEANRLRSLADIIENICRAHLITYLAYKPTVFDLSAMYQADQNEVSKKKVHNFRQFTSCMLNVGTVIATIAAAQLGDASKMAAGVWSAGGQLMSAGASYKDKLSSSTEEGLNHLYQRQSHRMNDYSQQKQALDKENAQMAEVANQHNNNERRMQENVVS